MSETGKKRIQEYMDSLKLDQPVTIEEFHQAVKSAYKDRSTQIYFIWKKLKELYPEVDANRVIREGSWDFGLWQGQKIADRLGAENIGPIEAVLGQTSKGGVLTFEQELLELEEWAPVVENVIYTGLPAVQEAVLDGRWHDMRDIRRKPDERSLRGAGREP